MEKETSQIIRDVNGDTNFFKREIYDIHFVLLFLVERKINWRKDTQWMETVFARSISLGKICDNKMEKYC